jgi:hypothetical protein
MNLMQSTILEILGRHRLDSTFNRSTEFHLRLERLPYLPLVIERQGNVISVAHYSELNGDLIRDPELTFAWPAWMPTSITQDPVGRYVEVFVEVNGKQQVLPILLRELQVFANAWARNLRAQGFTGPDVVASSLTHPLPAKT